MSVSIILSLLLMQTIVNITIKNIIEMIIIHLYTFLFLS